MNCPQCGNQWDASKGSCARCGFTPHLLQALPSDTSLRSGRYRLQKIVEQQSWNSGIVEVSWLARDVGRGSISVLLYEVFVPGAQTPAVQKMLRDSAHALLAVGRHAGMPTLHDVFTERERAFFVFEPLRGETIQARLQYLKHPLAEQEIVAFCLQVCEMLELMAAQTPPLVHGRINPEHIHLSYDGSRCSLSGLSPIIAMGVRALTLEAIQAQSQAYLAPEFAQGQVEVSGDLSSLIATAYYAATGALPAPPGGSMLHPQQLNPAISAEFSALLLKGLHPVPQQRYQRAAELRQDLLALRSRLLSGQLSGQAQTREPVAAARRTVLTSGSLISGTPGSAPESSAHEEEEGILLPAPEKLRPMSKGNSILEAIAILVVVFLSLGIATMLSNFHM